MKETIKNMIKDLEKELTELKEEYRDSSHQPPRVSIYYEIARRKHNATVLYAAVAMSRGRVHRHDHTLETQEEFVDKFLGDLIDDVEEAA